MHESFKRAISLESKGNHNKPYNILATLKLIAMKK